MKSLTFYSFLACFMLSFTFTGCKNRKNEMLPVPSDAELIIKIDGSRLSEKILLDKATGFDFMDLFRSHPEDTTQRSPGEWLLKDPGEAGVDYTTDFYVFRKNGIFYLAAFLDDEDDLRDFLRERTKGKVIHKNKTFTSVNSDFSVGFTRHYAIFCMADSSVKPDFEKLLNIPKEETIFSRQVFAQDSLKSSDILFTADLPKLSEEVNISPDLVREFMSPRRFLGSVNFEDGKMEMEMYHLVNPSLESLLSPVSTALLPARETKPAAVATISLNTTALQHLIPDSARNRTADASLWPGLLEALAGEAFLNVNKLMDTTKVFTTYEFDEDFNKVEKKDTSWVVYPSFELALPVRENIKVAQALNGLKEKNLVDYNGSHYIFNLLQMPVNIFLINDRLVLTEQPDPSSDLRLMPVAEQQVYGLFIQIHPQLIHATMKNRFEKIEEVTLLIRKETAGPVLHTRVDFTDKDKNGLLSLMKFLKALKPEDKINFTL